MTYFIKKNGIFLNTQYNLKTETQMERLVARFQQKEPDAKFELFKWDNGLTVDVVKKLEENHLFKKVNWNWDNKYKKEN